MDSAASTHRKEHLLPPSRKKLRDTAATSQWTEKASFEFEVVVLELEIVANNMLVGCT